MWNKIKNYMFRSFGPFMCGATVMANLSKLMHTNPNYDAQWWKVGLALFMGLVFLPLVRDD